MSMTAIVPIIILAVCIILSSFIFRSFRRMPALNRNVSKGFILFYLSVLGVAVITFIALPGKGETILSEKEVETLYEENMELESAFQKGEIKNLDHMIVDTFSYEETSDQVILNSDLVVQTKVWIEWIDSDASVIEGTVYQSHYVNEGINENLNIPQINWNGEVLSIKNERQVEKDIHYLKAALYINEFINRDKRYFHNTIYIHLKVPKHMELIDESGLQFN